MLSLFDGISCGRVALERAGIAVSRYFASEVDRHAIRTALHNYPDTVQIGDVREVFYRDGVLHSEEGQFMAEIDCVIGGSPCQGFSYAGKMLNFSDPRSRLFFEYARILKEVSPEYFILENVVMKKEYEDVISRVLGVRPVMIDSGLTSAAVRKRLYWTNIRVAGPPADRQVYFGDVRERHVPPSGFYYSEKGMEWIRRHEKRTGKKLRIIGDGEKMQMLEASMYKKYSAQRFFGIKDDHGIRYITPLECERCMNLPDYYTASCSNTQRYKQLGNGWEIGAVAHILGHMKRPGQERAVTGGRKGVEGFEESCRNKKGRGEGLRCSLRI